MPKLFVCNFPWETTEADLQDLFESKGFPNQVMIPKDRETGKSKGFGFIQLDDETQNDEAIALLNGFPMSVNGSARRPLDVKVANPPTSRQ